MPVNTTQYGIQKVFNIRGYDIATGELVLSLKNLTESTFTNGQETVYLTGGRANAQAASFDHSKTAMITGASSRIDDGLLAAQLGQDFETLSNTTEIEFEEILVVASDAATTTYTATGTADAEIGFVYVLNANGDTTDTLTQAAAAAAGVFAYTPGTKALAFNATDLADGTRIKVIYKPTASSAKKITNFTTNFSKTLRITADALLKDVCTDQLVSGQIRSDKGKIMGAFEWSLSSAGDPTVHNFECTFLETCGTEKLWDFYVYDEDDFS